MTYLGAEMCAAVFRSVGVNAKVCPESNERTLELGGLNSSGEECYPAKITLGDFLRILESDEYEPSETAFFMPTADGPCRFGQYAPYFKRVLQELGYDDVPVVTPTSKNSYADVTQHSSDMVRRLWRGLIATDALRKLTLKTRPYETHTGDADSAMEKGLAMLIRVGENPDLSGKDHLRTMRETLIEIRDMFRNIPARYTRDKPLIGVVGEIFCRMNTFSNRQAVRAIEAHGGEAWLSDMAEWVWYTNWSHRGRLIRNKKRISLSMAAAILRDTISHRDEHALLEPLGEDFIGYEDPQHIYKDMLKLGWDYLPADGALGEMALSVGKSAYLYQKGADGIIDISPFACMNGIVSEAVYHAVSRDHDQIPMRTFYFDATSSNMDRDLDIFMELAAGYRNRKKIHRVYPAYFEDHAFA